jgi:hypothetical protein
MKITSRGDTVYTGGTTSMSVTDDGGSLVYDEGVRDLSGWLMPLDELLANKFDERNRLVRSTSDIRGSVSPDGAIAVVGREHPQGGREFTVVDVRTHAQTAIQGRHKNAVPFDSTWIKITDVTDNTTTMYLYDYRRRKRVGERTVNATGLLDLTRVGTSWAWISPDRNHISIQGDADARARTFPIPSWYNSVFWLQGSPDGKKLAIIGYSKPDEDSLGVGVLSLSDLRFTQAYVTLAEGGGTSWMSDGSLMFSISDTPESQTLWQWKEGQPARRVGSIQRLLSTNISATVSGDGKWAFIVTRDDRRDIWMSKVVR